MEKYKAGKLTRLEAWRLGSWEAGKGIRNSECGSGNGWKWEWMEVGIGNAEGGKKKKVGR